MTGALAAPQVVEPSGDAAAAITLPSHPQSDIVHVFVKLTGQPAVSAYSQVLSAKSAGGSATLASQAAQRTRQQIDSNHSQQAAFVAAARGRDIAFQEIYRASKTLNGVAMIVSRDKLAALRALPGVASVRLITAEVPHSNSSVTFVNSGQVWTGLANGRQADGTGIRIGIIDSGIDYVHSHFGGDGALATYQALDTTANSNGGPAYFPTAKVVGGIDLAGDAYNAASNNLALQTPVPDPNPMDCNGHGTHVAGTAAGFGVTAAGATYTGSYATALPADLRIQPGVAPKASLYAIRVFGCTGSTDLVPEALDWALDPNDDGDFSDHLDVVNMSLGSPNGGLNDISAEAADNAAQSGIIVVASSGNSGDSYMITGSPAVSPRTISVAASMDGGEQAGKVQIATPSAIAGVYAATPAAFGPPLPASATTDTLVMANPAIACSALSNAAEISGKTVVIDRGTCAFAVKVANAQAAGAVAVIVANNNGAPIVMAPSGTAVDATITIPSAMISQADGNLIKAQMAGGVTGALSQTASGAGDLIGSFSSRGPNSAVPAGLKPDITAPGVNIVSAQTGINPGSGGYTYAADNQALTLSGTSMAAPHVAGLMALLKQMYPSRSVEQLKALAMNSANHDIWNQPADLPGSHIRYGAGRVGSGRIDAQVAGLAKVIAYNADDPGVVSLSFPGEVYLDTTVQKSVRIDNLGGAPVSLALSIDTVVDNPGVVFSLPQGKIVVIPANGSVTIPVKMQATADLIKRTYDPTISLTQSGYARYWLTEETAYLRLGDGDNVLRVPLYVAPYAVSSMALGTYAASGNSATPDAVTLTGTPVCTGALTSPTTCDLSATAPLDVVSLLSPLELQVDNPRNPLIPAEVNIRRAGVASDGGLLTFGIQTWGRWGQAIAQDADVEVSLYDSTGALRYVVWSTTLTETNVILTAVWRAATGAITQILGGVNLNQPGDYDTRLFQNDVMVMGVPFSVLPDLGVTASSGVFWYTIDTYDRQNNPADSTSVLSYDLGANGVSFGGSLQFADLPGVTVPVLWNLPALQANGSLGALFLHHHNRAGTTAEVLKMAGNVAWVAGGGQTAWQFDPMKVRVTDTNGAPVTGAQVVFSVPGTGATGLFPTGSNVATTGADGIAVMPMVSNGTAGDYTVVASVPGLVQTVSFSMTNVAGQTQVSGTVPGGPANASVAGSWMVAPISTGTSPTYSSGGFIPVTGHPRSPVKALPRHVSLTQGLVDIALTGGAPGANAVVTLTYAQPLPKGTQFWMFGATPDGAPAHWYRYNNVVISGNVVTLTVKDGAVGDGDAVANGLVRLLGGPGRSSTLVPTMMQVLFDD
jgi:subtilisin family serine protease